MMAAAQWNGASSARGAASEWGVSLDTVRAYEEEARRRVQAARSPGLFEEEHHPERTEQPLDGDRAPESGR
jgi:hypothetical protein